MTPFEKAHQDWVDGKLQAPKVYYGESELHPFLYQIVVHKYYLKLMSAGMRTHVKLAVIKQHYGLKGRTAKDVYQSFIELLKSYNLNLNQ